MNPSLTRLVLTIAGLCALAACAGDPLTAPSGNPVSLFKHTGARQCETPVASASRLQAELAALEQAGIHVLSARCGSDDSLHPAVCGGGTGDVWLLSLPAAAVPAAQARGYRTLDAARPVQVQDCR